MAQKPTNARMYRRTGIGLLEVVVVLAVVALLAVSLTTAMPHMLTSSRVKATHADMKMIHKAIYGRPDQGDFGFAGDFGRAPRKVDELIHGAGLPRYHTDHVYKVGMGWKGPYLSGPSGSDATLDAFGTAYRILADKGVQIQSAGPDGRFDTDDDLCFPEKPSPLFGDVRIELDAPGKKLVVRLYYTDNGHQQRLETAKAPYIFYDVPYGPHAVEVWKIRKKDDYELIRRTLVVSGGRGGIFKVNIRNHRGGYDE